MFTKSVRRVLINPYENTRAISSLLDIWIVLFISALLHTGFFQGAKRILIRVWLTDQSISTGICEDRNYLGQMDQPHTITHLRRRAT